MKNHLSLSPAGYAAIKLYEGLKLTAYKDKAGVWTIGYGSTYHKDGKPVRPGDKLADKAAADDLFKYTLQVYEQAVNQLVKPQLNQNQFDALVSFAYNEGTGALAHSHLLVCVNLTQINQAADQFPIWDKITDPATGKKIVCDDLVIRRKRERLTFLKPV